MGIASLHPSYALRADDDRIYYEAANKELRFFQTNALTERRMRVVEFPPDSLRWRIKRQGNPWPASLFPSAVDYANPPYALPRLGWFGDDL